MTKANKERGAASVEYAIIVALIAGVVISGTTLVGIGAQEHLFKPVSELIDIYFPTFP